MTERTGHMGNAFRSLAGGVDAVEGVFGGRRTTAVCGPVADGGLSSAHFILRPFAAVRRAVLFENIAYARGYSLCSHARRVA